MILTHAQAIKLLLNLKKSVATGTMLSEGAVQLLGLASILVLSKVGVNGLIATTQNKMADYGQKIQDFFGTSDLVKEHVYFTARALGYSEKEANIQADKYAKYGQVDNYKISRADVEIFEVSAFQGVFWALKAGETVGVGAFIATELALNLKKMQAEKKGQEFSLAKAIRQEFPNVAGLAQVARFLEVEEDYEVAGGRNGFHIRDEEFEEEYEDFAQSQEEKELLANIYNGTLPSLNVGTGNFEAYNPFDDFVPEYEGYTVFNEDAIAGMQKQKEMQDFLDMLRTDKITGIIRTDIPDGQGEYVYDPTKV